MNEMVQAIGAAVEEDILCEVKDSPYFSIIFNEATDIAVMKQLGICVQYLLNEDTTVTRDLKLLELQDGTAEAITETLLQYLTTSGLDLQCLVGGASDGASVMVGCHEGVMTKLKEAAAPGFVSTHCAAHRLSLAASNACKTVRKFSHLNVILSTKSVLSSPEALLTLLN